MENRDAAPIGHAEELRLGLNENMGWEYKNTKYLSSTLGPMRKGHIMSIIIKKTETGYELHDNGTITKNLKVVFDARKGCGDIKLPENTLGKKWFSESRFAEGLTEIDLENLPTRTKTEGTKTVTTPKLKWEDYVTDEDKEVLAAIKARAEKKMAKAEAEAKVKALMAEVERLQALMNADETEETDDETEETEG